MLFLWGLSCIAVIVSGCRPDSDKVGTPSGQFSENMGERIVDLAPFTGIDLRLAANVRLTPADVQEIRIQAPQKVLDKLNTEIRNGTWVISAGWRIKSSQEINIFISAPLIDRVILASSGSVNSMGMFRTQDKVELILSGSGTIHFLAEAKELFAGVSGSGIVRVEGKTESAEIDISGSGTVDAGSLKADEVEVDLSGSGDCRIDAREELDVNITGSGEVLYRGNPRIKSSIRGSGSVERMD